MLQAIATTFVKAGQHGINPALFPPHERIDGWTVILLCIVACVWRAYRRPDLAEALWRETCNLGGDIADLAGRSVRAARSGLRFGAEFAVGLWLLARDLVGDAIELAALKWDEIVVGGEPWRKRR